MHFLQTQSTARRGNRRTSWGIGTVARTAPKGTPTLYRWPSSLWKRSQSNSSDFYRTCPSGNRPDPGGGRGQEKSLDEKARGKSSSFLSLRGSRRGWGHNMKDGFHISRCSSIYFPSSSSALPFVQLCRIFCIFLQGRKLVRFRAYIYKTKACKYIVKEEAANFLKWHTQ